MTRRVCRTVDDAWAAGWDAPCGHGITDLRNCPDCRLTPAEIGALATLLRPSPETAQALASTHSAA
ncbi:hypothetical protein ACFXKG_18260 [Streptomyces sp. NPDC059255]|uniref:hypothetical protein n=1 Tax=Streptomyces sp. NPDC059255 TaxID=3346793 RepID=UPI00367633DD